jgi:hypothetical protein
MKNRLIAALAVALLMAFIVAFLMPVTVEGASANKFQDTVEQFGLGRLNVAAEGHELKVMLSNELPLATDTVKADIAEITMTNEANHGAGGCDIANDWSETSGTATMVGTDCVFEASGGTVGPFQYAVLYDNSTDSGTGCTGADAPWDCCTGSGTGTCPEDSVVLWWNYGSAVTLQDGETFTVDFGASVLTLQ